MTQRAPARSYLGTSRAAGEERRRFEAREPVSPGEGGRARWPMRARGSGRCRTGGRRLAQQSPGKIVKRGATVTQPFPSNGAGAELQQGKERAEYP